MKNEMEIKTPILTNITANGAKLVGTVSGWIDPDEICGVLSGVESIPKMQDKHSNRIISGSKLTTLITRGGQRIMAMGQAEVLRNQIRTAQGIKSKQQAAEPQEQTE
jgi:hypothetical protein